jgi:hypothetical protein
MRVDSLFAHFRAAAVKAALCSGQSCSVAGSKSAPVGQTSVCASGSTLTCAKTAGSRNGPKISPSRTGSKSMVWMVPSASALFLVLLTGCLSKPDAKPEAEIPETPLVVGDCVVLEPIHRSVATEPWRQTINAEGYINGPLMVKVKIVGKTPTEAAEFIESEYVRRSIMHIPAPALLVLPCDDYDSGKMTNYSRKRLRLKSN